MGNGGFNRRRGTLGPLRDARPIPGSNQHAIDTVPGKRNDFGTYDR